MSANEDSEFYQQLMRAYIDSANDAIFVLCDEMKFLVCNRLMEQWMGRDEAELTRHGERVPITELIGDADCAVRFSEFFHRALEGVCEPFECHIHPRGGQPRWVEIHLSKVGLEAGLMVIAVARDITERKTRLAAMEYQATHDPLTGLPNWVLLRERLSEVMSIARRTDKPLALISVSLNRFREINNILGPRVGDRVLCQVAGRLQKGLPRDVLVARHGGDEFSVFMPDTDRGQVEAWARRIYGWLLRAFDISSTPSGDSAQAEGEGNQNGLDMGLDIEFSIGIALYPEHGDNVDDLLRKAGVAVQVAKYRHGGIAFYDPQIDRRDADRLMLAGQLRRAIAEDALELHYQPIVDMRQRHMRSVEALVRWVHPQRGILPPTHFVTVAEQTGLIRLLDYWVLDQALKQCRSWLDRGLKLVMSVNLSARTLDDARLVQSVREALQRWDVPASQLRMEITESALIADPEQSLLRLNELSAEGVSLALDDFGTGYSSLAYLKRLPLHHIKIDLSFVQEMRHDDNDAVIVHSTIDLAHNLGLRVVAEGVEDEETWRLLVALGCDAAQGWYIARAMPLWAFDDWSGQTPWLPERA